MLKDKQSLQTEALNKQYRAAQTRYEKAKATERTSRMAVSVATEIAAWRQAPPSASSQLKRLAGVNENDFSIEWLSFTRYPCLIPLQDTAEIAWVDAILVFTGNVSLEIRELQKGQGSYAFPYFIEGINRKADTLFSFERLCQTDEDPEIFEEQHWSLSKELPRIKIWQATP